MKAFITLLLGLCVAGLSAQTVAFKKPKVTSGTSPASSISNYVVRNIDGNQSQLRSEAAEVPVQNIRIMGLSAYVDSSVIEVKKEQGRPVVVEKKRPLALRSLSSDTAAVRQELSRFIASSRDMFELDHPQNIRVDRVDVDQRGVLTGRGEQTCGGFAVYGTDFTYNVSAQTERFTGRTVNIGSINRSTAVYDVNQAIQNAKSDLKTRTSLKELKGSALELLGGKQVTVDTLYYPDEKGRYRLAYHLSVRPNFLEEWIYYIDATNGAILEYYNNTKNEAVEKTASGTDLNGVQRAINTTYEGSKYYLANIAEEMYDPVKESGIITTLDARNGKKSSFTPSRITSDNNEWNPLQISTQWGITKTYHYFKNTFGRNSLDGKGGTIIGVVNVIDDNGEELDNASWNGHFMVFGNGKIFKPLAGALDVIGHELAHGVIQHTAGLKYKGQSGAINESFADVFGVMTKRTSWRIGEDIVKISSFPSGAMRDMSNPHNGDSSGWQPASTLEMYIGDDDNGGVHINSGIPNYAFYKYATKTSKEKAEQVYYYALTHFLSKTSGFADLRRAITHSAKELYGKEDSALVAKAFDEVGILEDSPSPSPVYDLEPNPGDECMAVNVYDAMDKEFRLMTYNLTKNTSRLVSKVPAASPPSVTDDGKMMLYVGTDGKIYQCDMEKETCSVLLDMTRFADVAISKDGKLMAFVTEEPDSSIYVSEMSFPKAWSRSKLYNPGSEGKTYNVKYADHLEFDYTGNNIIYDACSQITDRSDYWTINRINVWNPSFNDFSDGTITPLISLNDGVSAVNPTFSKNSPHIIAFDYMNGNKYATYAADLVTGELKQWITTNNQVSYPTFGLKDNYYAFMSNQSGDNNVVQLPLSADKMSVTSSEPKYPLGEGVIATFPVYYGTGKRALGRKPKADFQAVKRTGPAPLTEVAFTDMSGFTPTSWEWTFEGATPATATEKNPVVNYEKAGSYKVTLKVSNAFGEETLEKENYIRVANPTSIEKIEDGTRIWTSENELHVYTETSQKIMVYDFRGAMVEVYDNVVGEKVIRLPKGIYIVQVGANKQRISI